MKAARAGSEIFVSFADSDAKFPAEIQNVSADAIKLWMRRKSNTGERARIEVSPGFHQSGTVLYCKPEDIGCITVINFDRDAGHPGRSAVRTTFVEPAQVSELGLRNAPILSAMTVDISEAGIALRMEKALAFGALVKIELSDSILFGEVRHCRAEGSRKFRIGLAVELKMDRAGGPRPKTTSSMRKSIALLLFRARAIFKSRSA
jgi:hypothetical protein